MEQIVEEQQRCIHTAQTDSNCDLEKMLIFTWKEHWQLAKSSDPPYHMSYTGLLSPSNNYLCQQSTLVVEEPQPSEDMHAVFWGRQGCTWPRGMHAPNETTLSGKELDFAGQFQGKYVHCETELLSPIIQILSKTNPKETQERIPLRLKATGFISKWRPNRAFKTIWQSGDATVNL